MDQIAPPSPTPSADVFPSGFRKLMQHNAATSYPIEGHANLMPEDPMLATSQPQSRFASPAPRYGTPVYTRAERESSPRSVPMDASHHYYSTPTASPPTPSEWQYANLGGRDFRRTTHRVQKPAQKKRPRAKKVTGAEDKKHDIVQTPLSEIAKDHPDVEITDIDTFVNRPSEERLKELENSKTKSPGRIKRPMNAFMLYRKAYQNLAKRLCTQNNHQLVSQVCGAGWPLEPDSMREQFNEWARIERANHQKAHPTYKFSPAKPKPKDDDLVHPESDGEWQPNGNNNGNSNSNGNSNNNSNNSNNNNSNNNNSSSNNEHGNSDNTNSNTNSRRSRGDGASSKRPRNSRHQQEQPILYDAYPGIMAHVGLGLQNPSMYQFVNPGRPMPEPYSHSDIYGGGQYYQQSLMPKVHQTGYTEDVLMRRTPSPALGIGIGDNSFDLVSNYPPLPSSTPIPHQRYYQLGYHQALPPHMRHQYPQHYPAPPAPQAQAQAQPPPSMIDPILMGSEGEDLGHNYSFLAENSIMGLDGTLSQDPDMQYLRGGDDDWQVQDIESVDWDKQGR